jgi:hypothetical protein
MGKGIRKFRSRCITVIRWNSKFMKINGLAVFDYHSRTEIYIISDFYEVFKKV